jgi:hypothetical protein
VPSLHEKVAMSTQGYAAGGGQDKGPLNTLNVGFLKSLTEKRTTRGLFQH